MRKWLNNNTVATLVTTILEQLRIPHWYHIQERINQQHSEDRWASEGNPADSWPRLAGSRDKKYHSVLRYWHYSQVHMSKPWPWPWPWL